MDLYSPLTDWLSRLLFYVANGPLVNIDVTDDYNNLTKAINNYNNTLVKKYKLK